MSRVSRRVVASVVGLYLLIGIAFSTFFLAGTDWRCPDPAAPHGYTTGGTKTSDDCEPSSSIAQRAGAVGAGIVAWPFYVVSFDRVND